MKINLIYIQRNGELLHKNPRVDEAMRSEQSAVRSLRGGGSVWGVNDPSSWLIQQLFQNRHQDWPLLFDAEYVPKPALRGVAGALTGKACTDT